jgi:hypothetical protein
VTRRKERKALARWEAEIRQWATDTGRSLVLAICTDQAVPATPYQVGVVIGPDEQAWVECPARFHQERPPSRQAVHSPFWPPIRPWLVTSQRIVGRLGDDRLYGYRWEHFDGCRVELTAGNERVSLDLQDSGPLTWTGPGVAPMAVAAVWHLHGSHALLGHPGLGPLRTRTRDRLAAELQGGAL